MKRLICLLIVLGCALSFSACAKPVDGPGMENDPAKSALPAAEPDLDSMFGVDKHITIANIDDYLGREDTVYRDMRMLYDPADYAAIGGDADLSFSIKGFKVVPYPFIGSLQALPVDGAYTGESLYTVVWNDDGTIASATPNYKESEMALNELFPKDKNIILTCGGGGYAGMMRTLLIFLGWDESKVYNIGGAWEYKGDNRFEIMAYPEDANEDTFLATWRADYAFIQFDKLHPVED